MTTNKDNRILMAERAFISWAEVDRLCGLVCAKIAKSGYKPDIIIAVARGGWVPARIISDRLGVRAAASMGITFYDHDKKIANGPTITQFTPELSKGKKVLLVDDVSDSGKSLWLAKEKLLEAGASKVIVATIHIKAKTSFVPDFWAKEENRWIEYPWEPIEAKKGKA